MNNSRMTALIRARERAVYRRSDLSPGMLIAVDFKAWRINQIEDVDLADWPESEVKKWERDGFPDPYPYAPYRLVVTLDRSEDKRLHSAIIEHGQRLEIIPEHYSVCIKCGDVTPCRESIQEVEAAEQIARTEKILSVPPGCCPACSEPITYRQRIHEFPGENVNNPLDASVSVRFHARRKCAPAAADYEEKWVKADPSRKRTLLTLRCSGFVTVHGDGTAECHGGNNGGECPSVYARHRGYQACFVQSAGCPRGCNAESHPGTRLAKNLTPDGRLP